ncbi:hypothetical protein K1T71_008874 [Dendrolimus kikuchii]|uniref:Uncharacterized protein n=1 Tax=Dendrolimus kikuchii TaxID=765133 RepID=A0ACC1CW60_9NEOP|nr:hypothetical protein K1T71_008874 [Dendrolimus kikuchii]
MKPYLSIILKLISFGFVIAASGFWAAAGVNARPKYRDEQTLVGGAIWSQIIIPIGLIVSMIVGDNLDVFIHGFFLLTGIILLYATGLILVFRECKALVRHRRRAIEQRLTDTMLEYDKIYFVIGILAIMSGMITCVDLIVLLIL